MYSSAFCRVYDAFGWNVYPEVFGEQLLRWLEIKGIRVRRSLDLGCGTGVLCALLAAQGVRAVGADLSASMIDIARSRAPELEFVQADMVTWRPEGPFDLVTCTGDALNHVFDPEDVSRVFENVRACLSPGGWFVFDLLNEAEVPPGEPFELDWSDAVRARFLTTREADGAVNLSVAVYENGALKFEENIREKVHPVDDVLQRLARAGFRVEQCADRLLLEGDNHGTTWFIAARAA